jgi:Protein kinase domain
MALGSDVRAGRPDEQTVPLAVHGHEEHEQVIDAPDVYDHEIALATPAITVNGFGIEDDDDYAPTPPSPSSKPNSHRSSSSAPSVYDDDKNNIDSYYNDDDAGARNYGEGNDDYNNYGGDDDSDAHDLPPLPLVLAPLQEYIHLAFDPRSVFADLQEVAQGQYGSVYAASVRPDPDADTAPDPDAPLIAVKQVRIPSHGTPKIGQLRRELALMAHVRHRHILAAEGLFFSRDADGGAEGAEDGAAAGTLWIRMELMERSLADVLVLRAEGLALEEGAIARFAADVSVPAVFSCCFAAGLMFFFFVLQALLALAYLAELGIAHRDVRSDNLLIGNDGVLKLGE